MGKNILVLTGSPRCGGNSDLMADAFIRGAKIAGHTVTKFETALKTIGGCRACDTCYSQGAAPCSFHDDFNELAPLLENADVLVLVTPMYWFTFPAQLKAALDKMYALIIGRRTCRISECKLLVCAETGDEDDFDGIVQTYSLIADYQKWKDTGILLVPGVNAKGDIRRTNALENAEKMGKKA